MYEPFKCTNIQVVRDLSGFLVAIEYEMLNKRLTKPLNHTHTLSSFHCHERLAKYEAFLWTVILLAGQEVGQCTHLLQYLLEVPGRLGEWNINNYYFCFCCKHPVQIIGVRI